jgi:hypothetical protein
VWPVILLLIGFASGSLITLLVVHFSLKRYAWLNQELRFQHQKNFQELISRVYHKDQIPRAKRIRGLTNLGLPATSKLSGLQQQVLTLLIRMLNQVEMFGRDHHAGWSKFALASLEETIALHRQSITEGDNLKEYWKITQQVSLEHEENVINTVKEFEQFQ